MKSNYRSSYTKAQNVVVDGTYVKLYSLGPGNRGLLITWQSASTTGAGIITSNNIITLTLQDDSTFALTLPTTFNPGGSNVVREFILPLIIKSAVLTANADPNL